MVTSNGKASFFIGMGLVRANATAKRLNCQSKNLIIFNIRQLWSASVERPVNAPMSARMGGSYELWICFLLQLRRNQSSADFQVCCVADFQIRGPSELDRVADLEVGDTAGLETCATPPYSVHGPDAPPILEVEGLHEPLFSQVLPCSFSSSNPPSALGSWSQCMRSY